MTRKTEVDIVIPTAGSFDKLADCLDAIYSSLHPQSPAISITVMDDASDKAEKFKNQELFVVNKEKDKYNKVVAFNTKRSENRQGFGKTCNEGARFGSGKYIFFLNDDVVLAPNAIEKLLDTMKDETIGVVGMKLLFPEKTTTNIRPAGKVQHVGIAMNMRADPLHPLVGWSSDNPKCNVSRQCLAVTGAALMVRRNIFSRVGGFDLMYGLGTYEDVDLCFKVRQAGFGIYINVEAVGTHYTGATIEKLKIGYPLSENNLKFKSKWANSGLLLHDEWSYY